MIIKFITKIRDRILRNILVVLSIFLLVFGSGIFIIVCNFPFLSNGCWQDLLIGISANLICSIITVAFVKYYFDKTEERKKTEDGKEKERLKILQYNRIAQILRKRYNYYFNALVSPPIDGRLNVEQCKLKEKIEFRELSALYLPPVIAGIDTFTKKSAVEFFFNVEYDMREFFVGMIKQIDFDYYCECRNILERFVKVSFDYLSWDIILKLPQLEFGEKKETLISGISQSIAQESTDNALSYLRNDYDGKGLAPYYLLFQMLVKEKDLLLKYDEFIYSINSTL